LTACEFRSIKLLDHISIGELGNYTFANAGRLRLERQAYPRSSSILLPVAERSPG
jgi:hypothetical protein